MTTLADRDRREEQRARREELRAAQHNAFEIVGDELPDSEATRQRSIPEVRAQLIKFAKANPGKWIRYVATSEDPFPRAYAMTARAKQGTGGFGPGFDAAVRNKECFICYKGPDWS